MSLALDDILERLTLLPAAKRRKIEDEGRKATRHMRWVPNPGPQHLAFVSEADELLYGGEVGGGKTDLILGAAIERHQRSLLLRRLAKEVPFLIERTQLILGGSRDGFNGQLNRWRLGGKQVIQYGGCQNPGDEYGYKGAPKDLIGIDEASEFLESQVAFLVGWLRSDDPKQHCQLILATNPPGTAEGAWVLRWFAPWLDRTHRLYPAQQGKLLWCSPEIGSAPTRFVWADAPFSTVVNGRTVAAISRTFIRSGVSDNPDYAATGYAERIGNLPELMRRRYLEGDFTAGMQDHERQLIPTAWVLAAQERWTADGGKQEPMTAQALDPAGGGRDDAVLACRHGGWYAPMVSAQGKDTADGSATAAMVTRYRRNSCPVVVDVGGGYAGGVILRLKDNGIPHIGFNGAHASARKTKDKMLKFANKRAEAWWKFMEELNPDQEGGSVIALPPDPELLADLTAPRYEVALRGILIESKDDIKARLGRSPGRGDAAVMALSEGNRAVMRYSHEGGAGDEQARSGDRDTRPKVVMGHMAARRPAR